MESDIEVNETEDRVMSFTEEEANQIRKTVERIKREVEEELAKNRDKEEVQGRSR